MGCCFLGEWGAGGGGGAAEVVGGRAGPVLGWRAAEQY